MKVTYFGTTTLLFDDGKDQILFDAHLTRPSLMTYLFGRIQTDTKVCDWVLKNYRFKRLRAIFVSHSHHDHVMDAPYIAGKCHADIYGSSSTLNVARGGNIPEERLHLFSRDEEYRIGDFRIRVIPSIHSKAHFYNNDLGKTIDRPLTQPAPRKAYKEGGSWDFIVENGGKTYLIRPSFNYLEGQLDGIKADVLFLGSAGLGKADKKTKAKFYQETIDKVQPSLVIPVHWDFFFCPLLGPARDMPRFLEDTGKVMHELSLACSRRGISFLIQCPMSSVEL